MAFECPHCSALLNVTIRVANAELLRAPIHPTEKRVSAKGRFHLTARESQMVDLAIDGLANSEIAKELNISAQVVKNYMSRAYDKIGASNRADMVRIVILGRSAHTESR